MRNSIKLLKQIKMKQFDKFNHNLYPNINKYFNTIKHFKKMDDNEMNVFISTFNAIHCILILYYSKQTNK